MLSVFGPPSRVDVTGSKPQGDADKRAVMANTGEQDRRYLMDRGYAKFTLWKDIHAVRLITVPASERTSLFEILKFWRHYVLTRLSLWAKMLRLSLNFNSSLLQPA